MRKTRILLCFIAIAAVAIIMPCLFLLSLARLSKPVLYELPQRRIRPMLKRFTGRDLPGKAEDLRGFFHSHRGVEMIYLAFQTDREGCSYMLDAFGGPNVKTHEFPQAENNPFQWHDLRLFSRACRYYQKKLGAVLFDEGLVGRIKSDALEYANTGRYPDDAVSGCYLHSDPSPKSANYVVLVFRDRGVVYLYAQK